MQDTVPCGIGLALQYGTLPVQYFLYPRQVDFFQPFSRAVAIASGNIFLHVPDRDEVEAVLFRDFHLDAGARDLLVLGFRFVAEYCEHHCRQRKYQNSNDIFPDAFQFHYSPTRFFSMSSIGSMNLSMLPAPNVTSTSTGSFSR